MANFELQQTGEEVQEILNNAPTTADVQDVANDLSRETINRENADDTLQANIDAEETARENADDALQEQIDQKQDALTFDFAPTEGSTNPVYSGAVKSALDQKQDLMTLDNQPTQYSDNAVKSGGIYDIWQALLLSIAGINGKIPSAATTTNQLVDKLFVNSSIATNTATFRGTSATGLSESQFLAWANGLTHDKEDYVFWQTTDSAGNVQYKRYKYNGSTWLYEYTLNNSSFTAAQWAAINSAITSADTAKLSELPTLAQLTALLSAKQDVINDLADIRSGAASGATALQVGDNAVQFLARLVIQQQQEIEGLKAQLANLGTPDFTELPTIGGQQLILFGDGAPSVLPMFVGQHYHDTTNSKVYEAMDVTGSTGDWHILN